MIATARLLSIVATGPTFNALVLICAFLVFAASSQSVLAGGSHGGGHDGD